MMKFTFIIVLAILGFAILSNHVFSQGLFQADTSISLSSSQKEKLIKIISTNQEAKDRFNELKKTADAALNENPNPIEVIQSSGLLADNPKKIKSLESAKDAKKVYALGFVYTVTKDEKYAKKAKEFILSWAKENRPSKNPINEMYLEPMFTGYDLVKQKFSNNEKDTVNKWLIKKANTLIKNINPKGSSAKNNHNSHLLNIVGMIAFTTNDKNLIDYAVNGYKKQIGQDLNPDGSSYDFYQRDALYYHVFTLEPLLTLARNAKLNGIDLFNYQAPNGATLKKSVEFLLPYAKGEKKHQEWIHSTAPFDKERAQNGQPEFQPGILFKPQQSYPTLELYSYFDPNILPLAIKLSGKKATKYPDFEMVYLESVK